MNGPRNYATHATTCVRFDQAQASAAVRNAPTVHPQHAGTTPRFPGHPARELHIPHKLSSQQGGGGWWQRAEGHTRIKHRMEGSIRTEAGEHLGT